MFTGYDGEATGFDSSWKVDRTEQESGIQTTAFSTVNADSQTSVSADVQTQASTGVGEESMLVNTGSGSKESTLVYQPGLNEFLNRVVPMLLEALDAQELERQTKMNESDSEEESQGITSSLVQCLMERDVEISSEVQNLTLGQALTEERDKRKMSVLGLSWSSGGNSLAVALGHVQHDEWCEHSGILRVYTVKRSSEDMLLLASSASVHGCVSCISWHSQVAALLAYATSTGDIHVQSVKGDVSDSQQLTREAHAARPITVLMWVVGEQTTRFVPAARGKKREKRVGASDQILVSAGSDGLVKIWQVNLNLGVLDVIVCYELHGASPGRRIAPDISCLDFMHAWSSEDGPPELRVPDDTFVVGTSTGELIVCKSKATQDILISEAVDPVGSNLEPQAGCVLVLAFCYRRPGVFASLGTDTQLRIYNVLQYTPLRVIYLDEQHTHFTWLPQNPMLLLLVGRTSGNTGVGKEQPDIVRIYSLTDGRRISVDGLTAPRRDSGDTREQPGLPTYVAVNAKRPNRVAVGDHAGNTYVWDIPLPRSDNTESRYRGQLPVPV